MADVDVTAAFWRGRSVFLTGHTGFKGGWLALWLQQMGARVHGYSTAPPTSPDLFTEAKVAEGLASHTLGDVRDAARLAAAMKAAAPDLVLHLAAQPLVRVSYDDPAGTFGTNVMGTVHLLDAVRALPQPPSVIVNVTTDKCYENREWLWGYREGEPLGGKDPYSSSKACSELVTAAYRSAFLDRAGVAVASARAGNVIGGGDWAEDRLIPDFVRAVEEGTVLKIRNPESTRPWQHVLEPLGGYLELARQLAASPELAGPYNFGPSDADAWTVRTMLDGLVSRVPDAKWEHVPALGKHEANMLKLDISKAAAMLGWTPKWRLEEALDHTIDWYVRRARGEDPRALCLEQIELYTAAAAGQKRR